MFSEVDNVEIQYIKSILYFNSQPHYFILFSLFHPLGLISNDTDRNRRNPITIFMMYMYTFVVESFKSTLLILLIFNGCAFSIEIFFFKLVVFCCQILNNIQKCSCGLVASNRLIIGGLLSSFVGSFDHASDWDCYL